jgi:hypothetical protein
MEIAMGNAESSSPCCYKGSVPQHALMEVNDHHSPPSDATTMHETSLRSKDGAPSLPNRSRVRVAGLHRKVAHAIKQWLQNVEEFLFPKCLLVCNHSHDRRDGPNVAPSPKREGFLLYGCNSIDQQYARIHEMMQVGTNLHGAEGLRALGFEFRLINCDEHKCFVGDTGIDEEEGGGGVLNIESTVPVKYNDDDDGDDAYDEVCSNYGSDDDLNHEVALVELSSKIKTESLSRQFTDSILSNDGSCTSNPILESNNADIWTTPSLTATSAVLDLEEPAPALGGSVAALNGFVPPNNRFCHLCFQRLYHIASNTPITFTNRKEFIADGDMYELICRFIQEYAHEVMIHDGNLKWITIDDATESAEPLRVLMSTNHPLLRTNDEADRRVDDDRPTILICTGRGKVRAGIFSRQNLICTGLEMSTAVPFVRDAVQRGLHVVLADPNVHGDAHGFRTFSRTMDFFEPHYSSIRDDLYVLSHSASGGHITRYFLEKSDTPYLCSIRAIAFTDSTHSIQWAKGLHQRYLYDLLQSGQCIYFRCSSSARDTISGDGNKWYLHPAGEMVQTDSFWKHRFGSIRTVWAGTNEHSMTNWFSYAKIWEHFDLFLHNRRDFARR